MFRSLVTGGAGFIGSHVVEYLLSQGHYVTVVDNESANNDEFYWNNNCDNFKVDITNYHEMKNIVKNVDYVFHLAAESRLQMAIENPIEAVKKNCLGTTIMLQLSKESGVKRFIYSSTSSGYGNNPYPNVETQPDDCLNPYSASKIAAEKFCKMYHDLYGLKTITLRYFNVFGERSPTIGQYAPVVGIFQRQKESNNPLTIVGNGSQRRDFVYVGDVARANYLAATLNLDGYFGQIFNVGSGKNYSIQEIANTISTDQIYIPKREGEMDTTIANINKITRIMGWNPEVDIIDWIKK